MITIKFLDNKSDLVFEVNTIKEAVLKAIELHNDLSYANLSSADLSYANLRYANLRYANLSSADLRYANLSYANLSYANLSYANLRSADFDFSCFPLWCGSLKAKIDKRLFVQLLYHAIRAGKDIDDKEVKKFMKLKSVIALANQFHRVDECGKIE